MGSALPVWRSLVYKPQIGLIYERGRLQGMAEALLSKLARCKQTKLFINDGRQVLKRLLVPARPTSEKVCHVVGSGHGLRTNRDFGQWPFYNGQGGKK
jgi:hypothetical protein